MPAHPIRTPAGSRGPGGLPETSPTGALPDVAYTETHESPDRTPTEPPGPRGRARLGRDGVINPNAGQQR